MIDVTFFSLISLYPMTIIKNLAKINLSYDFHLKNFFLKLACNRVSKFGSDFLVNVLKIQIGCEILFNTDNF